MTITVCFRRRALDGKDGMLTPARSGTRSHRRLQGREEADGRSGVPGGLAPGEALDAAHPAPVESAAGPDPVRREQAVAHRVAGRSAEEAGAVGRELAGRRQRVPVSLLPAGIHDLYLSEAPLQDLRAGRVW